MPAQQQSLGQLRYCIRTIRRRLREPEVNAKYTDAEILEVMAEGWPELLQDLYATAQNPPLCTYSVQIDRDTEYYTLPATVGEVQRVLVRAEPQGVVVADLRPRDQLAPAGPGIWFEGGLRFGLTKNVREVHHGRSLELLYIPSGDVVLHAGASDLSTATASDRQLQLQAAAGASPPVGELDRRPNAYLGCCLSVFSYGGGNPAGYGLFPVQNRIISQWDVASSTVTVNPPFDIDLSQLPGGSNQLLDYEVYPIEGPALWPLISRWTARQIALEEGRTNRYKALTASYLEAKRAVQQIWSHYQTRAGRHYQTITVDSDEYLIWAIF